MIRKQRHRGLKRFQVGSVLAIAVAGVSSLAPRAMATTKDNNNLNLNQGLSWVNGVTPDVNGDVAIFDSTFATGNSVLLLGGNVNWLGVQLLNPVQAVTINTGGTLTLGASGIDTTQSTVVFTINPNIQLNGTGQTWNAGGPLIVGGSVNAAGGILTINTVGTGATALVSGVISNGKVQLSGTGNATLSGNDNLSQILISSGTNTLAGVKTVGNVTLNGGRMNIVGAGALGTGQLILNGGSFDNLSGGPLTLNTIPITISGSVTFVGTNALNVGLGAITVATVSTLTLTSSILTLPSSINTNFSFTVAGGTGLLNMAPSNTFGTASTFTLAGGQINISGTSMIQAGTFRINGGTFDNTSGAPMTLTLPTTLGGNSTFVGSNNLTFGAPVTLAANSGITLGGGTITVPSAINGGFTLTQSGAGVMILSGSQNTFNAEVVAGGTMTIKNALVTNSGVPLVGSAGVISVLNVDGGTINSSSAVSPAFQIGAIAASVGVVNVINNGSILIPNTAAQFFVAGANTDGYGALVMNSGSVTIGSWFVLGANNTRALLNISGGTLTVSTNRLTTNGGNAANTNGIAQINMTGGALVSPGGIFDAEGGTAVFNLLGGTLSTGNIGIGNVNATGVNGMFNLDGGTVTASSVSKAGAGAVGTFNFNGGLLKATAAGTFISTLTNVFVNSGGAVIDDGGFAITVSQALLAPTGNGLTTTGLSISGTGFVAAPLVVISGFGGSGAAAMATLDTAGNLTGIVITNPGINYNSTVGTFTLVGGGGGAVITGTPLLTPNVSGGLTKNGTGVLTVASANSYRGATTVNSGTLVLSYATNTAISTALVNAASALVLNGSSLQVAGAGTNSAAAHVQTFASTALNYGTGADNISVTGGGTNSYVLNLGAITRGGVGVVTNFTLPAGTGAQSASNGITTTSNNANFTSLGGKQSILGGWATAATASGVVSSWAVSGASGTNSGNITALTVFSGTFSAGQDVDAPGGASSISSPLTINSLRFNTPGSYAVDATGGTLTIASGGILYSSNDTVSGSTATINNGALATPGELFVNQYNSVNTMSIGSTIAATALVKTGGGQLNLTNAANSISGKSIVYGGTLGLTADASLGTAPGGAVADQLTLDGGAIQLLSQFNLNSNRGILLNVTSTLDTNGFNTTYGGVISGLSSTTTPVGLIKNGTGILTLTNTETYTGPTIVHAGTLALTGSIQANAASAITVGNSANLNANLVISGGTITAGKTTAPSLQVGSVANADGDILMNGGVLTTANQFFLGDNGAGAYAAMTMNGGTVTSGDWFVVGSTLDHAAFNLNGGSFTVALDRMTVGAGATSSIAVANFSGGTFTAPTGIFVAGVRHCRPQ